MVSCNADGRSPLMASHMSRVPDFSTTWICLPAASVVLSDPIVSCRSVHVPAPPTFHGLNVHCCCSSEMQPVPPELQENTSAFSVAEVDAKFLTVLKRSSTTGP